MNRHIAEGRLSQDFTQKLSRLADADGVIIAYHNVDHILTSLQSYNKARHFSIDGNWSRAAQRGFHFVYYFIRIVPRTGKSVLNSLFSVLNFGARGQSTGNGTYFFHRTSFYQKNGIFIKFFLHNHTECDRIGAVLCKKRR